MDEPARQEADVIVIGGGIVGVCCALQVQRTGRSVTIIEPALPGSSTVKWSCGQFAVSEIVPLSKPGILRRVPGWMLDRRGPLAMRPSSLPAMLPWFLRFLDSARPSRLQRIAEELATLTRHALADYEPLIAACNSSSPLIGDKPVLEVFDTAAGLDHERPFFALRRGLGFSMEEVGEQEIAALEPAFAGRFRHGLLMKDWRAVSDTEAFIVALTDSFIRQGGHIIRGTARRIDESSGRATGVVLGDGRRFPASHLVLSAGVGSRQILHQLGLCQVPLAGILGYQVLLPRERARLQHSAIYADGGFCFTPMIRGLQIGGTIEFAARDAPPDFLRAELILEKARRIFPDLDVRDLAYGVGYRPFLPDTKPVIDASRRLPNVMLALGHGQLGLTLGAATGRLIAGLIDGRVPRETLAPFSAARF